MKINCLIVNFIWWELIALVEASTPEVVQSPEEIQNLGKIFSLENCGIIIVNDDHKPHSINKYWKGMIDLSGIKQFKHNWLH